MRTIDMDFKYLVREPSRLKMVIIILALFVLAGLEWWNF